ncbi:MAG: DNA recombination protein RmuC [Mariprofundaceae bacterium]|nr:DNA recombination protein RmuC [Mariprofundaceae bacterium]
MDIVIIVMMLVFVLVSWLLSGWLWRGKGLQSQRVQSLQDELRQQHTQAELTQAALERLQQENQQQQQALQVLREQHQQSHTSAATAEQALHIQQDLMRKEELKGQQLNQQLEQLRANNSQQQSELARLNMAAEKEQQAAVEKLALLEDAKTKLALEFKTLANQIFEEKQQRMTTASKESLDNIIKPMQKDISEFKARMEQVHKEDIEARSALSQHLQHLQNLNQQMSQDAINLTQALKGDNKAQGNWGEMILEKLLESSGLREGYEFEREQTFINDEGNRQRPDVIIRMPGDKQVIIDAKVSLTDYERAMNTQDDEQRKQFIRAHCKSMQSHIQTLAKKRYDHLEGIHSPDYVLMFMPIEGAYLMAIEADRSIFEAAFDQRIAVVTPSTLYATLKLVEQLWRYERQSENVAKLINRAGLLHDKVVDFMKSFEDVGQRLQQAQLSYDKAFGQVKLGRGSVLSQIKTLGELSGKAKKEMPQHLLIESDSGEST